MALSIRKIINGKVYDTDTATPIMDVPNPDTLNDFEPEQTILFQSPGDQFFLAGRGSAFSRWRQKNGPNSYCGGAGIKLIDHEQAQALMEEHGGPVEEYFEVIEG